MKDPFACADPAVLPASAPAPAERAAARRAVAAHSETPAEYAELLDMLGLLPGGEFAVRRAPDPGGFRPAPG